MTGEDRIKLFSEISRILKGIDETELDSTDGWWETSTGADFGSEKLQQLKELIEGQPDPIASQNEKD